VRAVPDQYLQRFADHLKTFLNGGHATHSVERKLT
jgi:hypothetical protein